MRKLGILLVSMMTILACSEKQTPNQKAYLSKIYSICPQADITNVEQKIESLEVEFLCNSEPVSMLFDKNGDFMYKETPYMPDETFVQKIQKKIQKEHSGWKIDEYSIIETPDTSFVKLEMVKNGIEEAMFFTLEGKNYKFKNYITHEPWDKQIIQQSTYNATLPYDVTMPDKIFELPEVLKEISGISVENDSIVYAIQDELGAVFKINIETEEIVDMQRFTDIGDFEDVVAMPDKSACILRSDGTIFSTKAASYMVNIPCMNFEGLYYDEKMSQYYISCKEPEVVNKYANKKQHKLEIVQNDEKDRNIYTYKLKAPESPELFCSVKISEIRTFIKEKYNMPTAEIVTCNPSAIAIHPKTNELYVLSASDRLIAVYDHQILKNVFLLSPEEYYKPEGLDFLKNGDMIISSEGMKKGLLQGQIYILRYKNNEL